MGDRVLRREQPRPLFYIHIMLQILLQFLFSTIEKGGVVGVQLKHLEQITWCEKSSVLPQNLQFLYVLTTPLPTFLKLKKWKNQLENFFSIIQPNRFLNMKSISQKNGEIV